MKKRINLKQKKRKKIKPVNIIILIIIILIITTFLTLKYINEKISPKLINYAELEIRKISNLVITKSLTINQINALNINDLFIITKNEKNEILTLDLNTALVNKIIIETTEKIQDNLKKLELGMIDDNNEENKDGVVLRIPSGEISNNFLLNNLGPKIPVKLKILGNIETKVNTKITNYGINNALIETNLDVSIKEKVLLPISTSEIEVTTTLPLSIKLISGTVPNFYSDGINRSYQIPLE